MVGMAARSDDKIIISCAITGGIHTPTMSDALPYRPEDIARQAIDAAEAGAAILHLHARDPATGRPTPDPKVFMRFLPVIKQSTDAVLNITTGGGLNMTVEDRLQAFHVAYTAVVRDAPYGSQPGSLCRGERQGSPADAWTRLRGHDPGPLRRPVRLRPRRRRRPPR